MSDQRKHARFIAWFPVKIEDLQAKGRLGVAHNVSQHGVLMVTNSQWEPGESVRVSFRVPSDPSVEHTAVGRIVRREPNTEDPEGLWPERVAIEFDDAVPELDELVERFKSTTLGQSA